jgi:hypothetical protein
MEKIRIRDGKKSDSGKTSRIRNTAKNIRIRLLNTGLTKHLVDGIKIMTEDKKMWVLVWCGAQYNR